VKNNGDVVNTLVMSDEAHFLVCGCVNKESCHDWTPNNPHEIHRPLHSTKVTLWCAVYSHGIIGPYFYENTEGHTVTVNAECFKVMLETFLRSELHPRQQDLLWFQQDGATGHTAQISFLILGTSPGLPDHAVPDYFLWG
jgi:hypothetical protein